MAELVDAADSKSVFERSGSSSLPRGTILKKDLEIQGLFFRLQESGLPHDRRPHSRFRGEGIYPRWAAKQPPNTKPMVRNNPWRGSLLPLERKALTKKPHPTSILRLALTKP